MAVALMARRAHRARKGGIVAGADSICYARSLHDRRTALCALLLGYLLGSIPFGLLLTRLAGKGDIRDDRLGQYRRDQRAADRPQGARRRDLLLDAAKGAAAVLLARRFWPGQRDFAAAGALLGHLYPVWLRFKGGKGVATLLGILIPLLPIAALVYAVVWLGLLLIVRIPRSPAWPPAASAPRHRRRARRCKCCFPCCSVSPCSSSGSTATNIGRLAGAEPSLASAKGRA